MAGFALATWIIVRMGSFETVAQRWRNISVLTVGTLGAVLTLAIAVRAALFAELLGMKRPASLWASTAGYSLSCALLPGGIGELTLPFYLKAHGMTVSQGLTVAVIGRLADIIISTVFVLPLLPALTGTSKTVVCAASIATGALMAATVLFTYRKSEGARIGLLTLPFWHRIKLVMASVLATVRSLSWQKLIRVALWTMAWKLLNAVMYWQFARSLHMDIRFPQVFNALILYSLLMILPVPSIAGFGTSEAGWMLALRSQGTSLSQAFVAGLTFHAGNLLLLTLLGGLPMLRLFFRAEPNLANQLRAAYFGKKRQRKGDVS